MTPMDGIDVVVTVGIVAAVVVALWVIDRAPTWVAAWRGGRR